MGSVVPVRRRTDYARAVILEIQRLNREAICQHGEPDVLAAVKLLEEALSDPLSRLAVIYALADVLSMSVAGLVPELASWNPPRPPLGS